MAPTNADARLADLVDAIAVLLRSVPHSQRPDGTDEVEALIEQLAKAVPRTGSKEAARWPLAEAGTTLEDLADALAALPASSLEHGHDLDPQTAHARVQELADAWARRDGTEIDRLVADLEARSPAAQQADKDRSTRINSAVSDSISASLRRSGFTPSSDE